MWEEGERFVCAFRGRRDSYQVPLALAEKGLLDQFITDVYSRRWVRSISGAAPLRIGERVRRRVMAGIPVERVRCLWGVTFLESVLNAIGIEPASIFTVLDQSYSRVAARRAKKARASLLLYSPYAWPAFARQYEHDMVKVLFQYHPHPDLEKNALREDTRRYPKLFGLEPGSDVLPRGQIATRGDKTAWRYADLILCASSFTKKSLMMVGADPNLCRVVPYGIDKPRASVGRSMPGGFECLFVGSGVQRKGLHHLLWAWRAASLPDESRLTIVSRSLDERLEPLILGTPRVKLLRGLRQAELDDAFSRSTLFVMPSLIEGFGQVYLEALAHGVPVLGTPNSGLPDLGGSDEGVFVVPAGDIEGLTRKLERLANELPADRGIRQAARSLALRFSWHRFRERLVSELNQVVSPPSL